MLRRVLGIVCLALGVGLALMAQAHALSFSFHQGGFAEGASVSGFFTGEDSNNNGSLEHIGTGEVTDFSLTFTGNSLVAGFTLGFSDLFGLLYNLDGGPLGDDPAPLEEGIFAFSAASIYMGGTAGFPLCGNPGEVCAEVQGTSPVVSTTTQVMQITSTIPEPAGLAILGIGLTALGALRRRRDGGAQL